VFFVTFVTFVADLFFGIFVADRVLRKPSWLIVFFVTFVTFVADRAPGTFVTFVADRVLRKPSG
jgi:hypothetical protein